MRIFLSAKEHYLEEIKKQAVKLALQVDFKRSVVPIEEDFRDQQQATCNLKISMMTFHLAWVLDLAALVPVLKVTRIQTAT